MRTFYLQSVALVIIYSRGEKDAHGKEVNMKKERLLAYLEWLEENQEYNAREYGGSKQHRIVNIECARVARMLREMIENGYFDE